MVKHRRGDVKPQWMRLQVAESAAVTFTEVSGSTPIVIPEGTVMEILKVFWDLEGAIAFATGDGYEFSLTTLSRATIGRYNDVGTLVSNRWQVLLTTSGAVLKQMNGVYDLTDGAGNGPLVGAPNIFGQVVGLSQAAALTINFAILYRLIKVSAEELIGIIAGN